MGRRGLLGASCPPGESIVGPQGPPGESIVGPLGPPGESIVGHQFPPGESIVGPQGPPGLDANVPFWVNATQSNVQLTAFGDNLAASRATNIDYTILINKPAVVLPGYLPPLALTADTQELSGLPTGNGVYTYISSVSPASGSLFRLSSFMQEARYNNVWGIVITLPLPIPSSIAKYAIRAHAASIFPSDFTIRFFPR
jgi:hypothetical protein